MRIKQKQYKTSQYVSVYLIPTILIQLVVVKHSHMIDGESMLRRVTSIIFI